MGRLLAHRDATEAYRRVAMDATIFGSDARALGRLCFTELAQALSRALFAHRNANAAMRGDALARALSALAGLRVGLDQANPLAAAFETLFEAAERSLRASLVNFDSAAVGRVHDDFLEIRDALMGNGAN